jgi:hypothetical protein
MPTYRIVNKTHYRATLQEETVLDAHGNPFVHRTMGPTAPLPVGTLVTDLRPEELAAFPDRFALVPEAALVLAGPRAEDDAPADDGEASHPARRKR